TGPAQRAGSTAGTSWCSCSAAADFAAVTACSGAQSGLPLRPATINAATTTSASTPSSPHDPTLLRVRARTVILVPRRTDAPPGPHQAVTSPAAIPTASAGPAPGAGAPLRAVASPARKAALAPT